MVEWDMFFLIFGGKEKEAWCGSGANPLIIGSDLEPSSRFKRTS